MKLVLQHNRFYVESRDQEILKGLLRDRVVREAHMKSDSGGTFAVSKGLREKVWIPYGSLGLRSCILIFVSWSVPNQFSFVLRPLLP